MPSDDQNPAIPIDSVAPGELGAALDRLDERERRYAVAQGFQAKRGRHILIPDADGNIGRVLFGSGGGNGIERDPLAIGKLTTALPRGVYRLAEGFDEPALSALAFMLASYRFDRYRKAGEGTPTLLLPDGADAAGLQRVRDGVFLARDLINTPANDLSPHDLAAAAGEVAQRFGARMSVTDGEALEREFPMLHAVGAASDRPPCLIDLSWGAESQPKVTLVGKGIVFDTGGLDIKPSTGMALMKKDMGGAANVLGLAAMIMDAKLKVRLRVVIPAAENAISGRAFRPGDVLKSRKGLSVEIGNTDAEGRLVLADAIAFADEESPDLLVTMATLTGAARVALGPELPPYYTDDVPLAQALDAAAAAVRDPIWRMPLWKPYDAWLASKIADVNHISGNAYAGSIVAALFLRRFVENAKAFAHFDIFAWNPSATAIGPEGGEAQAIRALFHYLGNTYA